MRYHFGVNITIDKAGRVVIPKTIRDRLNLRPGSELEISLSGNSIRLEAPTGETRLVRKKGVIIFGGKSESDIDIADFINRERETRGLKAEE